MSSDDRVEQKGEKKKRKRPEKGGGEKEGKKLE